MSIEDNSIFMSIEDNSIFMSIEDNSLFPNDSSSFPNDSFLNELFPDSEPVLLFQDEINRESLLFLADTPPFVDLFVDTDISDESEKGSIWDSLEQAIRNQVKKDINGAGKQKLLDSIQIGEIEEQIFEDVVSQIYYDVVGFYEWYFNPDDDRTFFISEQDRVSVPDQLRNVVKDIVDDNLEAMREINEIPPGQDVDGLDEVITDSLSAYILNWQDWYYDKKREEAIESYFEQKSFYAEIYLYDNNDDGTSYGDLTNILDSEQFDGISDVPYLSKELE